MSPNSIIRSLSEIYISICENTMIIGQNIVEHISLGNLEKKNCQTQYNANVDYI